MDFKDKCRTCLSVKDTQQIFTSITKHCYLGKSYKCVIIMLVPTVDKTSLTSDHCVCVNCAETLRRSVTLIHNFQVLEENLKRSTLQQDDKRDDSSYTVDIENNIQPENITVNVINENEREAFTAINISNSNEMVSYNTVDATGTQSDIFISNNNAETETIQEIEGKEMKDHNYSPVSKPKKTSVSSNNTDNRIITFSSSNDIILQRQMWCLYESDVGICDISTNRPDEVNKRKRIILVGSKVPIICAQCGHTIDGTRFHVCKRIPRPKEKCPICEENIVSNLMNLHLRKHEQDEYRKREQQKLKKSKVEERDLTCQTCSERFPSKEEFNLHLKIHPPYVCETCGKGFPKKLALNLHMTRHNDPNSFICEFCGKGFKDKYYIRAHLLTHADSNFKCDSCPKNFKTKVSLTAHHKRVHDKIAKRQCMHCGKMFTDGPTRNRHIRMVHLKERPHQCLICDRRFGRQENLRSHMLVHSGETRIKNGKEVPIRRKKLQRIINDNGQPATCKFCGRWQRDMATLKRHLETHFKRYPCQFCPLTFSAKSTCKRHEKVVHKGIESNIFRCNMCWKKLSSKEALNEHVKCHNKPRHSCNKCGKTFNRIFLMNHHKLKDNCEVLEEAEADEIIYDSLMEVSGDTNVIEFIEDI